MYQIFRSVTRALPTDILLDSIEMKRVLIHFSPISPWDVFFGWVATLVESDMKHR